MQCACVRLCEGVRAECVVCLCEGVSAECAVRVCVLTEAEASRCVHWLRCVRSLTLGVVCVLVGVYWWVCIGGCVLVGGNVSEASANGPQLTTVPCVVYCRCGHCVWW